MAARRSSIAGGPRRRRGVRAAAAHAGRSADRPAPVPGAGLQRVAGHVHARASSSRSAPSSSSRSTCSSCSACRRSRRVSGRCPRSLALHRRLDADAGARAPVSPGVRDRRRPGDRRRRLRRADPGRRDLRSRSRWSTASVIFSLGLAPVFTLATDLIVGARPPERAGAASAISETSAELGGALGIAILGSIGTAVYRGAMLRAVPAGVPAELAEAARDTLGGAVAAAASSPRVPGSASRARPGRRSPAVSSAPPSSAPSSRPCSPSWWRSSCATSGRDPSPSIGRRTPARAASRRLLLVSGAASPCPARPGRGAR